jgi:hypothetical protein
MKRICTAFFLLLLAHAALVAQMIRPVPGPGLLKSGANTMMVPFDSSNLPIVYINTHWQSIPNDPKIIADLKIIDNGYNVMNHVTDPVNGYNGIIQIEKRGSISQLYPQNSYTLKTISDSMGTGLDTQLLGMPKEHDWVLYGPYDDETLMRNALTYKIGRQMGHWAPRTRHCEVIMQVIWPAYDGVYVMMEKIKRDNKRVDIAKLDSDDVAGDSLTGGYIIAIDKNIWEADSGFTTLNNPPLFIKYVYPNGTDIRPQQMQYIQMYVDSFENALLSPVFRDLATGWRKYAEPNSFIDFFIIQELSKNIDAFKRSGYMYKDKASKGGKLTAGPFWDFNSAWYNAHACGFDVDTGWAYQMTCWVNQSFPVPFWWQRFMQDSIFTRDLKCRWATLRSHYLDTAFLFHEIDSMAAYLAQGQPRQFAQYNIQTSYGAEVDSLKLWLTNRMAWMDAHMPGNCWNLGTGDAFSLSSAMDVYPNPASGEVNIEFFLNAETEADITVYDLPGKPVKLLGPGNYLAGKQVAKLDLAGLPEGIYFVTITAGGRSVTKKLVKAGR